MRFDKYHWVDLNEPKNQELHFTPLNESTEKEKSNLKPHVLANSLWDIVHRFNDRKLVSESASGSEMPDFFRTQSWEDFKHHAEMMGEFLHINKEELTNAITTFENQLKELGGEEGVEQGFARVSEVQEVLRQSGIAKNGDSGGVIPEITIRHFLDLLNPTYKIKGKNGKVEEKQTEPYEVGKLIDMIISRKNRKLTKVIDKDGTIRQVLANLFKSFGKEGERIFRKIVSAGNYQKNGAAVGKTELALAMFFSDCKLPDKHGDIQLTVKDGNKAIEIKGSSAVITTRVTRSNRFEIGTSWNQYGKYIKNITNDILSELNLQEINPKEKKQMGEALQKRLALIDDTISANHKEIPKETWTALKFAILFGALFRAYAQINTTKKGEPNSGFDEMWIFNTDDDLGNNKESALLDSRIVKISANEATFWYNDGIRILNSLKKQGIDTQFQSAHDSGQGGFKAMFT